MTFRLYSEEFITGGELALAHAANGWGHEGGNRSPQLRWDGVPEGTKSFVLTMYDPDAPTGSGFWHWIVIDIPLEVSELSAGIGSNPKLLPAGARQMKNDAGTASYVGAAPPPGSNHRYVFKLHAVGVDKLAVPDEASGALVGLMTTMNRVDQAELTARYGS